MDVQERGKLTRSIWFAGIVGIIASSIFTSPFMGLGVLGLVFMIVAAMIVVTGFVWQWGAPVHLMGASREEDEKAKREHIEAVLRRLSDTQLETLRERLATGQLSDHDLSDMIEDEAAYKRKR